MGFFGDSFSEGSLAGFHGDCFANLAGWELGWDITQASVGGTGFITAGSNLNLQSSTRLDDALLQSFDALVVPMGYNDNGQSQAAVTAAVNIAFDGLRTRCPTKPIFVISPWNVNAPGRHWGRICSCSRGNAGSGDRPGGFLLS